MTGMMSPTPLPSAVAPCCRVRAVVFDAVGTLIHPQPSAPDVYARVAAEHGLALPPETVRTRFLAAYRLEEQRDHAAAWVTSEQRERDRWHAIVTASLAGVPDVNAAFAQLYQHYAQPAAWTVDPAAEPLFAQLTAAGLRLGLASNYDSRLESVLAGHAVLRGLLPHVAISSRIGVRKPGRGFFQAVAAMMQCEPTEILYVGDDYENDYIGATQAGFQALWLRPTSANADSERPQPIRCLTEVLRHLGLE